MKALYIANYAQRLCSVYACILSICNEKLENWNELVVGIVYVLDKLLLYSGIELVTQKGSKYAKYQLLRQLPSTKQIPGKIQKAYKSDGLVLENMNRQFLK